MWNKLVNTRYFSEAAIDYKRNKGYYTKAPKGSSEYREYWKIQETRCSEGYSVGDVWIPGRMYFYLNFFPIMRIPQKALDEARDKRGNLSLTAQKKLEFPGFWEVDYEWWNIKDIAWNGGMFESPSFGIVRSEGGLHVVCLKARGAGFSYKEAADGVYNYIFIPGSKSYYFAGLEQYLNVDGILNKVQDGVEFINANIPKWRKTEQAKGETMHRRASFKDKQGKEYGYKSEIIGLVVNDPNKVRGKRGRKITFEEAGSFKKLKEALAVAIGNVGDGAFKVGQISVFGTGGEEGPGIEGLEDIFLNPRQYQMMAFDNVWETSFGTDVGYFVPCTKVNVQYMDKDGNVDLEGATDYEDKMRALKAQSTDPKELDRRKAEYPKIPSEALNRLSSNPFQVSLVQNRLAFLRKDPAGLNLVTVGYVAKQSGIVDFFADPELKPIRHFPHKNTDDLTGAVELIQKPYKTSEGKVPKDMYLIVVDPYYKDDAEDKTSLFAAYVYKQPNNYDNSYADLPVAWFVARPQKLSHAYETLFNLAELYDCQIQSEIAGGGQGIIDDAKRRGLQHKLCFELEDASNKEWDTQKNRSYFMNMTTERKILGISYFLDQYLEVVTYIDGKPITWLDLYYDVAGCEEMARFSYDRNVDRISAHILYQLHKQHRLRNLKEEIKEKSENQNRIWTQEELWERQQFFAQSIPEEELEEGFTTSW